MNISSEQAFLVQHPDPAHDPAFQLAHGRGGASMFHYPAYGDLLSRTLQENQIDDPQARVIADLYRIGGVSRENVGGIEPMVTAIDRGDTLCLSLSDLQDKKVIGRANAKHIRTALGYPLLGNILFLSPDGLTGTEITENGEVIPTLYSVAEDLPDSTDDALVHEQAQSYAEEHGIALAALHYAFRAVVAWRPDKKTGLLKPYMPAIVEQYVVGPLDDSGKLTQWRALKESQK